MATSTLPLLWTSLAFAFKALMKKKRNASKTTLPLFKGDSGLPRQSSLRRNLKDAHWVFSEEHYLHTPRPPKNAINSHYFLPCCLVSREKESKMDVLIKCLLTKGKLQLFDFSAVLQKSIFTWHVFPFALHKAGCVLFLHSHQHHQKKKKAMNWSWSLSGWVAGFPLACFYAHFLICS